MIGQTQIQIAHNGVVYTPKLTTGGISIQYFKSDLVALWFNSLSAIPFAAPEADIQTTIIDPPDIEGYRRCRCFIGRMYNHYPGKQLSFYMLTMHTAHLLWYLDDNDTIETPKVELPNSVWSSYKTALCDYRRELASIFAEGCDAARNSAEIA